MANAPYTYTRTGCAHAAFQLDPTSDVAKMRESVECAILLIYPKEA